MPAGRDAKLLLGSKNAGARDRLEYNIRGNWIKVKRERERGGSEKYIADVKSVSILSPYVGKCAAKHKSLHPGHFK
jgi:hypothetical protein